MGKAMSNVAVLRAACCVAGLDRKVCERELPMLRRIAEYAGVGHASLQAMIHRAETDHDFYEEQFHLILTHPEATITALFSVACADGQLHEAERVILRFFADKLGLDEKRFEAILSAAQAKVAHEKKSPREEAKNAEEPR